MNGSCHPDLDDKALRKVAADVTRRSVYGIAPHVAGDFGREATVVNRWMNGERRSPAEYVYVTTQRSLHEAKEPRSNSLAMVSWLAASFLDADELEEIAAQKRSRGDGPETGLRLARRAIEAATNDYLSGQLTGEQAVGVMRSQRLIAEANAALAAVLDATAARMLNPEKS